MYIAGSYDDMQGGICYGGIAHAGPTRLQAATWYNLNTDYYAAAETKSINQSSFTVIMRVWFKTIPSNFIIFYQRASTPSYLLVVVQASRLRIQISTNLGSLHIHQFAPSLYAVGVWHTLAAIWDNGLFTGVLDNTVLTYQFGAGDTLLFPGIKPRIGSMEGCIKNCRAYNQALSITQIDDPPDPDCFWLEHNGISLIDRVAGGFTMQAYGNPGRCLIRGDGAVILNNQIVTS